ncbi:conserved hypothetical protein [Shewanella sediminis HAW-EB3]|uniref:Tail specific protease domain-containing protein n=1 Tax=Shewanella sediminis (strain HAW-EB3) TaxID=425104 RepID=A8FZX9_SHESH|nr:S41 family peptidase [Shewanella sediminis]ABV38402.1 conserved hypothetical protein [Shewanella sediminis HAW-EB3]
MRFGFKEIVNTFGLCLLISTLQLAHLTLTSTEYRVSLRHGEMRHDLNILVDELRQHSAFSGLNSSRLENIEQAIDSILYRYPINITSDKFKAEVIKLIAMLDDPGTSITTHTQASGVLPLRLRPLGDTWLALNEDEQLLDPQHPYITHIDGIPLSRWIDVSLRFIPYSLRLSLSQQIQWLSQLNMLRAEMGLAVTNKVRLTLTDNLDSNIQLILAVQTDSPLKDALILKDPLDIESGAALISITDLTRFETDPLALKELQLAFTHPLTILDLREVTGNSDRLLRLLVSEFAGTEQFNRSDEADRYLMALSQYRRSTDFNGNLLRPLNFLPFDEFNFFEQLQFSDISQTINNENAARFGHWYARRSPAITGLNTDESKAHRLALLIGPECREECEWIAYVAKSLPRVTLIGEKTSGDLGKRYGFRLPQSNIEVRVTASITYSARGKLLSGIGTQPDIELPINETIHWQGLVTLLTHERGPGENNQASVPELSLKRVETADSKNSALIDLWSQSSP